MAVYMIIESKVKDADKYREYLARVPAIVARYGGRYLARGGRITSLLGDWKPERMIVLEFPAESNVQEWLSSAEYRAIAPLREAGADIRAVLVEGCAELPK